MQSHRLRSITWDYYFNYFSNTNFKIQSYTFEAAFLHKNKQSNEIKKVRELPIVLFFSSPIWTEMKISVTVYFLSYSLLRSYIWILLISNSFTNLWHFWSTLQNSPLPLNFFLLISHSSKVVLQFHERMRWTGLFQWFGDLVFYRTSRICDESQTLSRIRNFFGIPGPDSENHLWLMMIYWHIYEINSVFFER